MIAKGQPNYYDLLGAQPDDPPAKIQALYWLHSRDAYPRRPGVGNVGFQYQLNEAYSILKNPETRADYNRRLGLPRQPRALSKGHKIYAEVVVKPSNQAQTALCSFTRWEPCSRCWQVGCAACAYKGRQSQKVSLEIVVQPKVREVIVQGQGALAEPKGQRGDLIVYVIRKEVIA